MIDDDHEEVRRLADELGLKLVPILRSGFGYVRADAGRPGQDRPARRGPRLDASRRAARAVLAGCTASAERRWDTPITSEIARRSVAQWLDDIRADDELRATAAGLRGFFLADPEELSLLALVDEFSVDESPGSGQDVPGRRRQRPPGDDHGRGAGGAGPARDRAGGRVASRSRRPCQRQERTADIADPGRLPAVRAAGHPAAADPDHAGAAGAAARSDRAAALRTRHQDPAAVRQAVLARRRRVHARSARPSRSGRCGRRTRNSAASRASWRCWPAGRRATTPPTSSPAKGSPGWRDPLDWLGSRRIRKCSDGGRWCGSRTRGRGAAMRCSIRSSIPACAAGCRSRAAGCSSPASTPASGGRGTSTARSRAAGGRRRRSPSTHRITI